MAKRFTKADAILNESAMRLEAARIRERTAQSELNTARATREALQEAHDALEKALARQPRKKAAPPVAQKDLPVDKPVLCGACGNEASYTDHFEPSPHYHKFEDPQAKKKVA